MTVDRLLELLQTMKKNGVKGDSKIRLFDTYGEGYIENFEVVGIHKLSLPNEGGIYFKFNLKGIKK